MNRVTVSLIFLGLIGISGLIAAAFLARPQPMAVGTRQLTVAASIFPLADIIQQIGGNRVRVALIIPPGVSEHDQALTPQQLQALQPAQAIFQIGHELDNRLIERIKPRIPDLPIITVDRGIELREYGEEAGQIGEAAVDHEVEAGPAHDTGIDPHYWLTAPNAIVIATTIADTLTALDSPRADEYQRHLRQYQAQLNELEHELQAQARSLSKPEFIATHNAWSYFAHHYGLSVVATYEPVEGHEPSVRDIAQLRTVIQRYGITAFFAEPQKASSAATNFMAREFGLTIMRLDPVGGSPDTNSYLDLMRYNMNAIAAGAQ